MYSFENSGLHCGQVSEKILPINMRCFTVEINMRWHLSWQLRSLSQDFVTMPWISLILWVLSSFKLSSLNACFTPSFLSSFIGASWRRGGRIRHAIRWRWEGGCRLLVIKWLRHSSWKYMSHTSYQDIVCQAIVYQDTGFPMQECISKALQFFSFGTPGFRSRSVYFR